MNLESKVKEAGHTRPCLPLSHLPKTKEQYSRVRKMYWWSPGNMVGRGDGGRKMVLLSLGLRRLGGGDENAPELVTVFT